MDWHMRSLSLVQQFSLVLFITLLFVSIFFGKLIASAMKRDMIDRSNEIIAGFVKQEINDKLQLEKFLHPVPETDYEELTRQIEKLNLGPNIFRIKIWNKDKTIVWSSNSEEVGQQNQENYELNEVLMGSVVSDIATQGYAKEKYAYELEHDIMELYIPAHSTESGEVDLIFELYTNIDQLLIGIARHNRSVWIATMGVTIILYLVLFTIVWRASRHIDRQRKQIGLSEERYSSLIHSAHVGIVSADTTGKIDIMNQAAGKMFGYSSEEKSSILFQELFGQETRDDIKAQLAQCFTFGECTVLNRSFETEGRRKDGMVFPLEVSLSVSGKGKDHILTGLFRDITEQKQTRERQDKLQEQLYQVQKMDSVGKLAGGIAHDFNNMLSAIIGYSEIVLLSLPHDRKLREDVKAIKDAGQKAAALTKQLLAFSRKQVLDVRPLDLNSVVEGMVKMLSRVIGEDVKLELHLESEINRVLADQSQIEQVLLNLAVNARDAMPKGGNLIIETAIVEIDKEFVDQHAEAKSGRHVLLAISDTGTGIPDEFRQSIFEPFFTTKEVGKGTGLGLATVYGIVKQHGGQIYVYSELEKGTTFKIFLPVSESEIMGEEKEEGEPIPASQGETVLIAEDDETIRRMIKSIMEAEGYKILEAADGEEAIAISKKYDGEIKLLLSDVIMPKINGRELALTLQKNRPTMEVIFMSGYTDDVISHHGVLDEGVHFIQKPITPSVLAKKLKEVFRMT